MSDDDEDQYKFPAVRDRFQDIRALDPRAGTKLIGEEKAAFKAETGENAPETQGFEHGDPLGVFFNIAKRVQNSCDMMRRLHKLYKVAAYDLTDAIENDKVKIAQGKIDKIKDRAKSEISGVKAVLDQMEQILTKRKVQDEKEAKEAGDDTPGWTTVYRVMYNCKWSLLINWREVNKEFNEEQASCERRRRKNLVRQLTIINDGQEPDKADVEERMASGATDVFAGGMVARSADDDFAAEFLAEAKEKEAAIDEILEKAQELQELWDQFQLLLQKQGELLNQIGTNLDKCKDFVAKANEDLDSAIEHEEAANRKQLMIVLCCGGMAAVVVAPMMLM